MSKRFTNGNARPGPPQGPRDVSYSHKPGTGRIDQGGGPTTGLTPESTASTNTNEVANPGQTKP